MFTLNKKFWSFLLTSLFLYFLDYPNKRPRLDFNNIPLDLERPPTPLLNPDGLSWDYQESPKLEEELRVGMLKVQFMLFLKFDQS